ncbi:MAG: class I SAM-dependent methyltransferase [Nitrososphaerales archaeon]
MYAKLEGVFRKVMNASSLHYVHLLKHLRHFSSVIGFRKVILDVGSGESPYRSLFQCNSFVRIDIDKRRKPDLIGDICNLPIRCESTDAVLCIETLEHVPDTSKALTEIRHVLRGGGYFILTVPFLFGVHAQADYYRWTERGLRLYLEKYCFEILELEKNGGIFCVIGETMRHAPYYIVRGRGNRWIKYSLLFILYVLLILITKLFRFFDLLDVKRDYTTGYCVLSIKK